MTNLRHLTQRIISCYTHKMAIVYLTSLHPDSSSRLLLIDSTLTTDDARELEARQKSSLYLSLLLLLSTSYCIILT